MKHIALLRFHKDLPIVQNRIELLKYFNPEVEIYGLFGGEKENFELFKQSLKGFSNITYLNIERSETKWRFSDLCILQWYKDIGHTIEFDVVYTIEYDLIYLSPLEKLIMPSLNTVALTGLIKLSDIHEKWDWLTEMPYKEESERFLAFVQKHYGVSDFYGCLGPGTVLPRAFLNEYVNHSEIPMIAHDEIRLPQLAQAFGFNLSNTYFYNNWNSVNPEREKSFNCNGDEISIESLKHYINQGIKVFHPIYKIIPKETYS